MLSKLIELLCFVPKETLELSAHPFRRCDVMWSLHLFLNSWFCLWGDKMIKINVSPLLSTTNPSAQLYRKLFVLPLKFHSPNQLLKQKIKSDEAHCMCSRVRYQLLPFCLQGLYGSLVCKMILVWYHRVIFREESKYIVSEVGFFLTVLHFDISLSQLVFLLTDPRYHNGLVQRLQLASIFVLRWAFISV